MIESPQQRFERDKAAFDKHHDLVVSDSFLRAVDASLLKLLMETKPTDDAQQALAGFHRMTGAVKFVQTLLTLTEKPKEPPKTAEPKLNWNA